MTQTLIPCQRHRFDIPADVAYLNCAYMGPLMDSVRAAGEAGVRAKGRPWEILPRHFFEDAEVARGLFAGLIGAAADEVAIVPAVSYGMALAAANLPVAAGQAILVLAEQFPSNVYTWRELAAARGAEVVTLARPADDDWTAAVLAALDREGERAAVLAVPHCHWTNGALLDLVRIGAACRRSGAALVIDATQSLGALPLDVGLVRPDFLVAATYKWLLGPYCLGFCYIAPQYHEGRPLEHNWIARANSEDFAGLVDYRAEFQPGARRFDVGQRGNFHLIPMAVAALEAIAAWGVAEIQATLRLRTDAMAARAADIGLGYVPRDLRPGHYLGLDFPDGVPPDLAERLAAEQVYVSIRGRRAMRVTPHLWVTDADVERFFAVLEKAL
jgi:selenocysteine lyase/cysteine desulfurase